VVRLPGRGGIAVAPGQQADTGQPRRREGPGRPGPAAAGGKARPVGGQRGLQRPACLGEPAAQEPVPGRARQAQRQVRLLMPDRALQCAVHIGGLAVEALEPRPLAVAAQPGTGPFGEGDVELAVPPLEPVKLARLTQPLGAIGRDRLQQPVAGLPRARGGHHDQGPVHQTGQQAGDVGAIQALSRAQQSLGQHRDGPDQVLAVVEHQQHLPGSQGGRERVGQRPRRGAVGQSYRGGHELGHGPGSAGPRTGSRRPGPVRPAARTREGGTRPGPGRPARPPPAPGAAVKPWPATLPRDRPGPARPTGHRPAGPRIPAPRRAPAGRPARPGPSARAP